MEGIPLINEAVIQTFDFLEDTETAEAILHGNFQDTEETVNIQWSF